jgi:hypothetical protein
VGGYVAAARTTPTTLYYSLPTDESELDIEGVYRSRDAGLTWSGPFSGGSFNYRTYVLAGAPSSPSTLYAGNYAYGFYRSADSGETWEWRGSTFPSNGFWSVESIAVDPSYRNVVYAGAGTDGGPSGIWKTTNGGKLWFSIIADQDSRIIVIDPLRRRVVYVALSNGLYRSPDGGASWHRVSGTRGWEVRGLAIDPTNGLRIFASLASGRVMKSVNGGRAWKTISRGLPAGVLDGCVQAPCGKLVINRSGRTLHLATSAGVFDYTDTDCAGHDTRAQRAIAPWVGQRLR